MVRVAFAFLALFMPFNVVHAGCAIQPDAQGHVNIPSEWTSIGDEAFRFCRSLESISIPFGRKHRELCFFLLLQPDIHLHS